MTTPTSGGGAAAGWISASSPHSSTATSSVALIPGGGNTAAAGLDAPSSVDDNDLVQSTAKRSFSERATVGATSADPILTKGDSRNDLETEDESNVGRRFFINPNPKDLAVNHDPPNVGPKWVKKSLMWRILFFPYLAILGALEHRRRRTGHPFCDNKIRTARYTLFSFLPAQIFVQFSKFANMYFLLVSILQYIPDLSPTGRYSTIIPLSIFVTVSILKELYDDLQRHRHDAKENNATARRLRWNHSHHHFRSPTLSRKGGIELLPRGDIEALDWENVHCKNLQVGDVVLVKEKESVPADMVVLCSSNENGVAFIETSNLDGETNLKQRQAIKQISDQLTDPANLLRYHAMLHVESPNGELYGFEGYIMDSHGRYPLTVNQLLLRSSFVRNTKSAVGVVVYSGEESKIRMNSSTEPAAKKPTIERITNRIIFVVFLGLIGVSALMTLFFYVWNNGQNKNQQHWYLLSSSDQYIKTFAAHLILYNAFIPISLYVSLEVIKVIQVYYMNCDLAMYDHERDIPAEAHTSSLNEELGQVQYIFSDKTGTLTENSMEFKMFSTAGRSVRHFSAPENMFANSICVDNVLLEIAEELKKGARLPPQMQQTFDFLEAMALCHTVVPENDKSNSTLARNARASMIQSAEDASIIYQSSSADEVALVSAARDMFFTLKARTPDTVSVNILNALESTKYRILCTIDFTSDRKRMSVIYRYPNGRIVLLCKGADSVINERLAPIPEDPNSDEHLVYDRTVRDIGDYASEGLRTLMYGYRVLDDAEYHDWAQRYADASTALHNRSLRIAEVAEEIEQNLSLLGATAIEDRLQDGVPETIDKMRRANIKVWMLTGDKTETAINIGHTCTLIHKHSAVLRILDDSKDKTGDVKAMIDKAVAQFKEVHAPSHDTQPHIVLVVDGYTLSKLQKSSDTSQFDRFLGLAITADNVICCRFSPSQKALIVSKVKKVLKHNMLDKYDLRNTGRRRNFIERLFSTSDPSGVTLAIGDGANDIPMIESAHVGIGITGREGLAASRASDYSIAKFRFLQPLLFVHGRWSYVRNSVFTLGTFYKHFAFYGSQTMFQAFTASSSSSLFEQWTLASYAVVFSSLQVCFVAVFEKDLNRSTLMGVPELYAYGQQNRGFNLPIFIRWSLHGFLHAAIAVFLPAIYYSGFWTNGAEISSSLLFGPGVDGSSSDWIRLLFSSDGSGPYGDSSLYVMGTVSYTAVVLLTTLRVLYIESRTIPLAHHTLFFVVVALWIGFNWAYGAIWPHIGASNGFEIVGNWYSITHSASTFFALVLLCVVVGIFISDVTVKFWLLLNKLLKHGQTGGRNEAVTFKVDANSSIFENQVQEADVASKYAVGQHDWSSEVEWWQRWESVHKIKSHE